MEYVKMCKYPRCGKEFTSSARNAAFCSKECRDKYYRVRIGRRKEYSKKKEENQILSAAYRVANLVMDLFAPDKICAVCGDVSTSVHHVDANPLNNDPNNLIRVCEACHKKKHTELPDYNVVSILNSVKEVDGHKLETYNNIRLNCLQLFEEKMEAKRQKGE